jgi:hypothetical protein
MLRAEPYPDLACRTQFREFVEDGADGTRDRFVGMKTNFTLLLAPHIASAPAENTLLHPDARRRRTCR